MADTNKYTHKPKKDNQQNEQNPTKFYTNFLYKAIIVSIFLLLLPYFPSQAPEFITQNSNWELLQLIFVGIAVSYGLFSKRNNNVSEKENAAQSFVSKLLEVSVFDEEKEKEKEKETPCVLDDHDNSKVQTWNSQVYRNEPMVVVAENSSLEEKKGNISRISETPLLLPIRSLKTHVSEFNSLESMEKYVTNDVNFDDNESVVLRSPIPWRSRSGRLEKETFESFSSLKSNSNSSSPSRLSPANSFSSNPSNVAESVRKKGYRKASSPPSPPPPPPPPPPPYFLSKSPLESNSNCPTPNRLSPKNSFSSNPRNVPESVRKKGYRKLSPPPSPPRPPPPPPPPYFPSNSPLESNSNSSSPQILSAANSFSSNPRNVAESVKKKGYRKSSPPPPPPPPPPYLPSNSPSIKSNSSFIYDNGFVQNELKQSVKSVPMEYIEHKKEKVEKVVVEPDHDSACGEDFDEKSTIGDEGPDVDKKADEFIARFREQIRLQRIASIRKSTGQLSRSNLR